MHLSEHAARTRKHAERVRVRILFFDHTAVLSGGELALLSLVGHLDRTKYDPVVVLGQTGPLVDSMRAIAETYVVELDPSVKDVRKDGIGLMTLINPLKAFVSISYVLRLARRFRALRADLIHTNSLKSDILGGIAAKLIHIPLIWHVRDRIEESYLPSRVTRIFRRLCRVMPDGIIANSSSTLQTLHLAHDNGSYVIPSGFDVDLFKKEGGRSELLSAAIAQGSVVRLGIVGRISPWKGQEIFIRVAQRVHHEFPATHFYLIGSAMFGEDDFERSLHQLVRECSMEDAVTFMGFREDIAAAIGELHILIHASTIPEPLGQVIAQGMAALKPVIATIGGGPSEMISHGETGILVPPGDVPAMTSAILELLRDPFSAEVRATRAQEHAIERFSPSRIARAVEEVYANLLGTEDDPKQFEQLGDRSFG